MKYLADNDPEGFGCACTPKHTCGPCRAHKQQAPLRAALQEGAETLRVGEVVTTPGGRVGRVAEPVRVDFDNGGHGVYFASELRRAAQSPTQEPPNFRLIGYERINKNTGERNRLNTLPAFKDGYEWIRLYTDNKVEQ